MNNIAISYADLTLIIGEVIVLLLSFVLINSIINLLFKQSNNIPFLKNYQTQAEKIKHNAKIIILFMWISISLGLMSFNGYLIYTGVDITNYYLKVIQDIPANFWQNLVFNIIKVIGLFILIRFSIPLIERFLNKIKKQAINYEQIKTNDESIEHFFDELNTIQKNAIILFTIALSAQILLLPLVISSSLFIIARVYLIITIGLLSSKGISVLVDSVQALGKKYSSGTFFEKLYERLVSLVPLFRRTLEYIIYILTATLAISQVDFIAQFAEYGSKLVQIIGVVFLSRVLIEVGNLLIDVFLLQRPRDLSDTQWQQRLTLGPLGKSLIRYGTYFGAFLIVLRILDVNTAPILAAIGGIGLIIGLGAQPVINDLVSGMFIIFENLYLVGDYIETADAEGVVEAIDIRTTRVRNPDGQVHILRNGQLGDIVNFSKGYIYAVVGVKVAYDSDLDEVYRIIDIVGEQIVDLNEDAIEKTQIEGVSDFDESAIIIDTITKAKPGRHREVAFHLRKLLKEAFEKEGIEIPLPQRILRLRNT